MKIILEKTQGVSTSQGTDYFFVVDLSGSMYGAVNHLKETLRSTKDLIGPKDTISIGYFSSHGDFDWFIKGASLTNHSLDALIKSKVVSRGLTCYDQILESLPKTIEDVRLLSGNKSRALYFLSDGWPNDNSTDASVLKVCSKLSGKFDEVRVLGYSGYYNRNLLLSMAKTMNGQFSHVSDHIELEKTYKSSVKTKKLLKKIKLDAKYDLVWQVANDISIYDQNPDFSVDVLATDVEGMLFGVNYDELDDLNPVVLNDPKFVYSLAMILSKAGKPNLGVKVLRKAGGLYQAKMLQKAFTVAQKGRVENDLTVLALDSTVLEKASAGSMILMKDFLGNIEKDLGEIYLDLDASEYSSISKKKTYNSLVKFQKSEPTVKIVKIQGNENRPSINFLTVRKGEITEVTDPGLRQKVEDFNKVSNVQITFPIPTETYKNYNIVSNGDFSFKRLSLITKDGITKTFDPSESIELFDPETKEVSIKDFTDLNKNLIYEKAHASVLNWYIKANSTQKHFNDVRVTKYGVEGAKILEEMGLDYEMRYTAKAAPEVNAPDADYIPMLEIAAYIKGCSKVSASDSRKKFDAKGKQNAVDAVMWPLFEKIDKMKTTLKGELFVKALQTTLKGVEQTVKVLSQEIAAQKFYVISTNSWFSGIEKSDAFEYDGLAVNVKYTKEYI